MGTLLSFTHDVIPKSHVMNEPTCEKKSAFACSSRINTSRMRMYQCSSSFRKSIVQSSFRDGDATEEAHGAAVASRFIGFGKAHFVHRCHNHHHHHHRTERRRRGGKKRRTTTTQQKKNPPIFPCSPCRKKTTRRRSNHARTPATTTSPRRAARCTRSAGAERSRHPAAAQRRSYVRALRASVAALARWPGIEPTLRAARLAAMPRLLRSLPAGARALARADRRLRPCTRIRRRCQAGRRHYSAQPPTLARTA